ncbi:MAG: hypothetical protein HY951_09910 [Bacteroidia bacterium]|nr:hypothetical protein [Bacteroidia bacterium]
MKILNLCLFIAFVALISCKKADETKQDPFNATSNMNAATNNSIASSMFDDVYKQVDYSSSYMKDSCAGKKSISAYPCATITLGAGEFNLTTWPKHITVDFGTGCTDSYGVTRKGKVIYTASNWMHEAGSVCTVTTNNYYVNDYKVEGTKTITNQGLNASQHLTYHVVVTNGVITHPAGEHHTWTTDRVTEWLSGQGTPIYPWDDEFSTTGSASGVTTANESYTITIDSANPLLTSWTCRFIKQGKLTIVVGNQPSILVDYGTGACDGNASFTIYGQTYNVVIQ